MAEFDPAVQKTLQIEGGFYHNPVTGEIVNHGITLTFIRDCGYCATADEVYIRNLTAEQATEIYRTYFWERYHIGDIGDQDLANKTFDLTVNMGPGGRAHEGALTLLQRAINDCGGSCIVDGQLGPQSIKEINRLEAGQVLSAYRRHARARYEEIAAGNPKLACDLPGWIERLNG